jgi:hypothetical protein
MAAGVVAPIHKWRLGASHRAIESDTACLTEEMSPYLIAERLSAAAIGVRKAGDEAGLPALHDFWRIGVEYPVIMAPAVFRERFLDLRVRLERRCFQVGFDHAKSAERENERLIRLHADDHLIIAVDISGLMGEQC